MPGRYAGWRLRLKLSRLHGAHWLPLHDILHQASAPEGRFYRFCTAAALDVPLPQVGQMWEEQEKQKNAGGIDQLPPVEK